MAHSIKPCKILWADPCCHGNEILGYFFAKIAYKSACMPDRPHTFGPTRGDEQGADLCCQLAMATTFALGAESNRLPACLSVCLSVAVLFQIASFFVAGIEPFLAVSSPCGTPKKFFLDF